MITRLHDLFRYELQDIFSAEQQILEALPEMVANTSDERLSQALQDHIGVTQTHLDRLERIDRELPFRELEHACHAIEGILLEAHQTIAEIDDDATRDVAIIVGAQKVEQYEITVYSSLRAIAQELELSTVAAWLEETLREEKQADATLSSIAQGGLFRTGVTAAAQQ